jgi:hypothetical protein
MSASSLPDIRPIRLILLSILGIFYFALIMLVGTFADGGMILEALIFLSGILAGMWVLQWAVLAGEAMPQKRSPLGLIVVLALAFGAVDALLVGGWNTLTMTAFGWINVLDNGDWLTFFMFIGFLFGVLVVGLMGWWLPKYDFLRLVLWMHLLGCVCQTLVLPFIPSYGELSVEDPLNIEMMEILGRLAIAAGATVLWWGITPLAYLIAYRGYRKRLALVQEVDLFELAQAKEMP